MLKCREIISDIRTLLTVSETQVFSGTSPATYTDLDLSSVVGARAALVLLKITNGHGSNDYGFSVRRNGDTDDVAPVTPFQQVVGQGDAAYLICPTDTSGVIEWICEAAVASCTVDVVAYIA